MGSISDLKVMEEAVEICKYFGVEYEIDIVSAHRTPAHMFAYAQQAESRGLKIIIAGAGGAAHLPGMVASETNLPVIGVPIQSRALQGLDSLLSIVQMPGGIPVATMAIGTAGARNAAIFAARILALTDANLRKRLDAFVQTQSDTVLRSAEL